MQLSPRRAAGLVIGIVLVGAIAYSISYPVPTPFDPRDAYASPTRSETPCVSPPLLAHSVAPNSALTYRIVGSVPTEVMDTESCIHRAFTTWNDVLQDTGIHFVLARQESTVANVVVYFTDLPVKTGGAITPVHRRTDGYLESTAILLNKNALTVSSCLGYYKVTLHEIGHVLGLGHPQSTNESSVMNNMTEADDASNDIPVLPTTCDVAQVDRASHRVQVLPN